MMTNLRQKARPLKEYVKALENKDSRVRDDIIVNTLSELGIKSTVQECRWPEIRNIIVDFSNKPDAKQILFTAHYDVAEGSPGANDNASGVAVLLGLCNELRHREAPVKIVFFDREEAWFRTPIVRLGLLGSLYYVLKNNMQHVSAVYNLEFCGLGDSLAIWPIKKAKMKLPALHLVEIAALRLGLPLMTAHIPWMLLSSDHMSFRLRGVKNALTLSLLPKDQIDLLEKSLSKISLRRLLAGQRQTLPKPLDIVHTNADTSDKISENSLALMLSLLLKLIDAYSTWATHPLPVTKEKNEQNLDI